MNAIKIKILAVAGASILFLLIGFFVWIIFPKTPAPEAEQTSAPTFQSKEGMTIPILPIPKPNIAAFPKEKSLPTSAKPFFENINKAAKTVEKELTQKINTSTQNQNVSGTGTSSTLNTPKATPTEIVLSLTDKEFHSLYPDVFLASLMDAQNIIKENFDSTYEPLPKIASDPQVRFVEEKIINVFLSANIITKDEAERFLTTIRFTLPQLQLMELKKGAFSSLDNTEFFNFKKSPVSSPRGLFFADLLSKLRRSLICPAQAYACGGCYWSPECFQPGASSPTPGMNIWRVACYCTGCLYGQGCLDFCTGRAAIYDPTTGLCGC